MSDLSDTKSTVVRYGRWRNQFIIAPVALVLGVFFWHNRDQSVGFWVAMVFLGLMAVFSVVPSETRFDCGNRVIERRWNLFGVLTVFRRRLCLANFRRICWRRIEGSEAGDLPTWMVGLEPISGRPVYVNCFNAKDDHLCEEARQFAIELSKLTGLPLSHEIDAHQ